MGNKRKLFIGGVYEDKASRDQVVDWARRGQLGDYEPVIETEDRRPQGPAGIKEHLRPMIAQADAVVTLVGDNSHNHEWVDWEVAEARRQGIPVVPVRLPNATGTAPREVRSQDLVPHTPSAIKAALEKK